MDVVKVALGNRGMMVHICELMMNDILNICRRFSSAQSFLLDSIVPLD